MPVSLKDKNRPALVLVVLANIAIYISILNSGLNVQEWFTSITQIEKYIPLAIISIVVGILNAQLGHENKARLVFWRLKDPLAGCRAFSKYASRDSRIDKNALQGFQDPLPTSPREQNGLWYKWYLEFQNDPRITQVHREYLFTRDYTGLAFLMVFFLGALSVWQFTDSWHTLFFVLILIIQYLVVRQAAKNHGIRFVSTVLALKSTR